MVAVDAAEIHRLYRAHAGQLHAVRAEQRAFLAAAGTRFAAQLDDIEAEITYLLLRERKPSLVVELGCLHGWSTTWILRALRDNGHGMLRSHDMSSAVTGNVPAQLRDRWLFARGDARRTLPALPEGTEYLFIDADHGRRFARWYVRTLFAQALAADRGVGVSVHDVFHGRRPKPFSEGKVLLDWLTAQGVPWYTPSRAAARAEFDALCRLRGELGLDADLRDSAANPMVYFELGR